MLDMGTIRIFWGASSYKEYVCLMNYSMMLCYAYLPCVYADIVAYNIETKINVATKL